MTDSWTVNLSAPPPPGVECECEKECACPDPVTCEHPVFHWHQRAMGTSCDGCNEAHLYADFHVYTRAGAFEAIANYAREQGWTVTEGQYLCPTCVGKP